MSESLILELLRAIHADMGDMKADMRDLKHCMTALETQIKQYAVTEARHHASLSQRLSRIEVRLEHLGRRPGPLGTPA